MQHIHREIQLREGDLVEVFLTGRANVQLLDAENYDHYLAGQPFEYYGGYAAASPMQIEAPAAGTWHLTVDLGGGPGAVSASLRILSQQMAEARHAPAT